MDKDNKTTLGNTSESTTEFASKKSERDAKEAEFLSAVQSALDDLKIIMHIEDDKK